MRIRATIVVTVLAPVKLSGTGLFLIILNSITTKVLIITIEPINPPLASFVAVNNDKMFVALPAAVRLYVMVEYP